MLTEQEKYVETAILLSEAGASKDVIIRSLVQKGADLKTAKQVTRKIIGGKQRKHLFFYLLAMAIIIAVSYVMFGKLGPWAGVTVAIAGMAIVTVLFGNGPNYWHSEGGSGVDYRNLNRKFFKDDG